MCAGETTLPDSNTHRRMSGDNFRYVLAIVQIKKEWFSLSLSKINHHIYKAQLIIWKKLFLIKTPKKEKPFVIIKDAN